MRDKDKINDIVQRSIDMHVHVGPEVIPRKYTAATLAKLEAGRIRGAVLKNHFYATSTFSQEVEAPNIELYGGLALNFAVGGLNPDAISAAASITDKPIVVWLPTISADNFLTKSKYEIAPEWCSGKNIKPRKASSIQGIRMTTKSDRLTAKAKMTIRAIKSVDAVLATGHISWQESRAVIKYAQSIGQNKIIVTHPIYQKIAMPLAIQKELIGLGAYMEICYSMFSIDGIAVKEIVEQIRELGPTGLIISSDVGQVSSLSPSQSLKNFCKLLLKEKIPVEWLETMLVMNPVKLLNSEK